MLNADEIKILVAKAQNGDEEAKNQLIEQNSPLIKSIIKRFYGKGLEYDDLYQLGCLGFVKAIKNFNAEFNVKFSTYVVPMVIGEIKRFMRDDGAIKVSRAIKSLNLKINKFVENYYAENKASPTVENIAKHFGVEEGEIVMAMDSAKMPLSLYSPTENSRGSSLIIDGIDSLATDENLMDKIAVREMLSSLTKRDRAIILMRYFYDKTQSEIAQKLNISQVQVSRLENRILNSLKKKLS